MLILRLNVLNRVHRFCSFLIFNVVDELVNTYIVFRSQSKFKNKFKNILQAFQINLIFGYVHSKTSLSHVSDRKSTRLNSSHVKISYAVFCLKKKITKSTNDIR